MNKNVEVEARPRPLSTGLWTLFSWLRRDDRSISSESLSSAGSDRTVASFAFLTPAHYLAAPDPLILPPPGPPTDSYKKRVHDRNLRRQYDRDLTLHRKYGLFKNEGGYSYDAFSLPPVRRGNSNCGSQWDRDRRAASECLQRRTVYVSGKRRAPAPPVTGSSSSLPRRHTRKRPAPQPPGKLLGINKENHKNLEAINTNFTQMNVDPVPDKQKLGHNDVMMGCKSEKYSKKETTKEIKLRPEKNFLKQIFDSKKRNSAIDTSSVKILPSISELDKQAAEIIETCKNRPSEQKNNVENVLLGGAATQNSDQIGSWICVSCLRKYNSSLVTCLYCVTNKKTQPLDKIKVQKNLISSGSNSYTQTEQGLSNIASSSKNCPADEKQKLKEMLKEMKDSLPKRPKHDINGMKHKDIRVGGITYISTETPTLRVGQSAMKQDTGLPQLLPEPKCSSAIKNTAKQPIVSTHMQHQDLTEAALVTQPVVIANSANVKINCEPKIENNIKIVPTNKGLEVGVNVKPGNTAGSNKESLNPSDRKSLHTPLKISSLLNPFYVPKDVISGKPSTNIPQPTQSNITQIIRKPQKSNLEMITPNSSSKLPQYMGTTSPSDAPCSSTSSQSNADSVEITPTTNTYIMNITPPKSSTPVAKLKVSETVSSKIKINESLQHKSQIAAPSCSKGNETHDQHTKRRDLINQLEQSIAKGDERAAAEAAAKLAQLRLSCSVLSFSSQILSQAATSSNSVQAVKIDTEPNSTAPRNEGDQTNQNKIIISLDASHAATKNVVNDQESNLDSNKMKAVITQGPKVDVKSKHLNRNGESSKGKTKLHEPTTSKHDPNHIQNMISIAVLVEDREATRGPVHLRIKREANMKDLRREAETSLGLATNLQRWIIGRTLCADDNTPVASLAGTEFSAPFYLCIVESETKISTLSRNKTIDTTSNSPKLEQAENGNVYTELVQLEQQALVPNAEIFECGVCMEEYAPGRGVVLRDCVHIFCRECLSDVVRHCEEPDVPCPAMGCRGILQEREIRAIVSPEDYERWLARGLAAAESGTRNAFHCRTRDCTGWALCEPGVQRFPCPVCKCINCVPCQAIHEGETCQQHQAKLKEAVGNSTNQTDEGTRTLLNSLISKGEALECPECKAIITKKWGCDWVKCSACKTEICWVTRGRRWGPGGRGDTSGGCRCGVDGKRCHPSCGYCH